jgi:hypothetical protein
VPCPSAHDRARNRHRSGIAWSKSAVRVILTNPRYTGRQAEFPEFDDPLRWLRKTCRVRHPSRLPGGRWELARRLSSPRFHGAS